MPSKKEVSKKKSPMKMKNIATTITKTALSLGIIVMMNLFFHIGLTVFNPHLDYETICPNEMWETQSVCEEYGGTWEKNVDGEEFGYCLEGKSCWEREMEANKSIESLNFIILASLGVLALIFGALLKLPSAVSSGLMFGGVISILIGWARSTQYLDDIVHFGISGVLLIALIVLGIKKIKD